MLLEEILPELRKGRRAKRPFDKEGMTIGEILALPAESLMSSYWELEPETITIPIEGGQAVYTPSASHFEICDSEGNYASVLTCDIAALYAASKGEPECTCLPLPEPVNDCCPIHGIDAVPEYVKPSRKQLQEWGSNWVHAEGLDEEHAVFAIVHRAGFDAAVKQMGGAK